MLVLHGFADDEELLKSAANVAAAGASNLRDALRHLHSEIRFRFEEMEGHLPGQAFDGIIERWWICFSHVCRVNSFNRH